MRHDSGTVSARDWRAAREGEAHAASRTQRASSSASVRPGALLAGAAIVFVTLRRCRVVQRLAFGRGHLVQRRQRRAERGDARRVGGASPGAPVSAASGQLAAATVSGTGASAPAVAAAGRRWPGPAATATARGGGHGRRPPRRRGARPSSGNTPSELLRARGGGGSDREAPQLRDRRSRSRARRRRQAEGPERPRRRPLPQGLPGHQPPTGNGNQRQSGSGDGNGTGTDHGKLQQ